MKKNIFIGLGVIVLVLVIGVGYVILTTKSHSPFKEASANIEGTDITIGYCQPYKKGRLLFGDESEGALMPYNKYWRLGANEATTISFSTDVNFGGKQVAAGDYIMYAVPGKDTWDVYINTEVGRWGASEADHDLDVIKVSVPAINADTEEEQLTIKVSGDGVTIQWGKTLIAIPITK